jgi:hypothetical protein
VTYANEAPDTTPIRCKFVLQSVTDYGHGTKEFRFAAQYDMNIPEDRRFNSATPTGDMRMMVNNPAVIERYKVGQAYYFDCTEAPYSVV